CNRRLPPAGAGTRTQHTNSALPMSRAATLAMICSSSCDSANIAVISSFRVTPVHLRGVVAYGYRMGTTILILVLELAATVKGPNAASDARLDTRPRRTTVLDGVDRRPPHNFHPLRATARSEWLVR